MIFMGDIIEIRNLVKKFGDFTALDSINLKIKEGQIYGILGPNGAGKTTTISIVLGIEKPTRGQVLVDGMDNIKHKTEIKQLIGFMTQETIVDSDLTAYENLEIAGRLYHLKGKELEDAIKKALDEAELTDFANKKAGSFSGGMKRRLYLVKSMIQNPKVLILDEPTTGLDVHNRVQMWDRIRELNKRGMTIILTTQYLEEADELCNEIAIIDHGKLIASGTASELKKSVSKGQVIEIISTRESADKIAKMLKAKFSLAPTVNEDRIEAFIDHDVFNTFSKVMNESIKEKLPIISISLRLPTMDDVFMKLTGSSLRDKTGEQSSDRSNIMLQGRR